MKVAICYDRVNTWGGAERVLLALHELFPDAPLYTSVYDPKAEWAAVFPKIYTSFLQKVPYARRHHEWFGWVMGLAFERFNFDNYDIVISVSSEAAKGIVTTPKTLHICYCLTPTRYLWSGHDFYFRNKWLRWVVYPVVSYLKNWDKIAAQRPDVMVGISETVAGRIKKYYGREVKVIYPPVNQLSVNSKQYSVDGSQYCMTNTDYRLLITDYRIPKNYFLVVSRLVLYKHVDLAIKAFNQLKLPLIIVGTGRDEKRLRKMAKSNIHFVGNLTDQQLAYYYSKATALIFPQEEDFGIVAVEAQLMGIPVIAYKSGGATETIIDGKTGMFFSPQTSEAIVNSVLKFRRKNFNSLFIKNHAQQFSKEKFIKAFQTMIKDYKAFEVSS